MQRRLHVIMKKDKPKLAPKVPIPPRDQPFKYHKEHDAKLTRDSAQAPMTKKRLSK
jgi:hypothetical protein